MLSVQENERLTRVGPGTPMGELMRRYWHPIAPAIDLKENPTKAVRILGEDLVLYKDRSGTLGLLQESCPHRRVNLLYGIPEEHGLRCPYHGWLFDETGRCLEQPAEAPDSTFKDRVTALSYPVQELGGLIWAYLGPAPAPLIPRWDIFVMDNVVRDIGSTMLPCNWLQCMENSLDPCHTEWLHGYQSYYIMEREGKGDQIPRTPDGHYSVFRHLKIGFDIFEHGIYKRRLMEGMSENHDDWTLGHPILFPNTLRITFGVGTFQIRVPVDDTHTWHVNYHARLLEAGEAQQTEVPVAEIAFQDENGEAIRKGTLPQDMMAWWTQGPMAERHLERLATSDQGIILYRRLLKDQIRIVEDGGEPMNVFRDPAKNVLLEVHTEKKQYMMFPNDERKETIIAYENTRYAEKT
jgi:5,5'-dehydrodivanillate O-demethylase